MKMRNKRKALHRKYAGAKKIPNDFLNLYKEEWPRWVEKVKQWMKDNHLVFED